MFELPLEEKNVSGATCNIPAESQRAEVLRKCDLIVWDEIPMSHRFSVEALNLTLQDLMGNNMLMGGKTVLFSGDLRQIGPVVKFGGPAETIDASSIISSRYGPIVFAALRGVSGSMHDLMEDFNMLRAVVGVLSCLLRCVVFLGRASWKISIYMLRL